MSEGDEEAARPAQASAVDSLRGRTHEAVGLVTGAVGGLAHSAGAVPGHLLASVETVLDKLPPVAEEVDVVLHELRARRLTLQAVQEELAVLDEQLGLLEQSLAPLAGWTREWSQLRTRLRGGPRSRP